MKKGYCNQCRCKPSCEKLCTRAKQQANRKSRKRQVKTITTQQMDGAELANWNNKVYGAFSDPNE